MSIQTTYVDMLAAQCILYSLYNYSNFITAIYYKIRTKTKMDSHTKLWYTFVQTYYIKQQKWVDLFFCNIKNI